LLVLVTCGLLCISVQVSFAQLSFVNIGYARDGNYCNAVEVSSNFAYVGYNTGLRIYDVSNPTNLTKVGFADDAGFVLGVTVSGVYAYVANGNFDIYNVSSRTNPIRIADVGLGGASASDVAISGGYAYLITGRDGFRIFNVSNPTNPISLGHFDNHSIITDNHTPTSGGVAVSGHYAYVANGNDGLRVFDVSNPTNPVSIFQRFDGGNALSIIVSNNYAFLANNNDGIRVYDISNPSNVVNIGQAGGAYATKLFISSGYLYAANDVGGLHVYDISNVTNVLDVGNFRTQDYGGGIAEDVAVSGMYPCVANWNDGLRIFQIIPSLRINAANGQLAVVSWPAISVDFLLQENSDLNTTNWVTVTNLPSLIGNRYQVTLALKPNNQFYRLNLTH